MTCGQQHDSLSAPALIAEVEPACLLADKAYDVDAIRADLKAREATAVIPPKANRVDPAEFDKELYKARSEVECTFNLLKQARRFATRYEKTLRNYVAVVAMILPRFGGQSDYAASVSYSRFFLSSTNFVSNAIGLR